MSAHCIFLRRCFGLACITVGHEAVTSHGLRKKRYIISHIERFPFLNGDRATAGCFSRATSDGQDFSQYVLCLLVK